MIELVVGLALTPVTSVNKAEWATVHGETSYNNKESPGF